MEAHWCCCLLGLTCMLTEVFSTWTVSQHPLSISNMRINSTAEIVCSTTRADPYGLYLYRSFHNESKVFYLSLERGLVTRSTPSAEFEGRIHATPQIRKGYGFTLQLSQLRQEDTDVYFCSWIYFIKETASIELLNTTGTIIIIREIDHHQCRDLVYFIMLFVFSVTLVLLIFTSALIVRFTWSRNYRVVQAPRPARPPHVCQHYPYMITSVTPMDYMDTLQ